MYEILKPCEESYIKAAEAIKQGKVVVAPTDSVYSVICDAFNENAVRRLREIRQSPEDKPLSLIMDVTEIEKYCNVDDKYKPMLELLLPGKVSFLMNKKSNVFDAAVPNSDAVCVFWQNNETRKIYEKGTTVLAISSANTKSNPEATTIEQALNYFKDKVDLFIDSGEERGSKGTSQLDIREDEVKIMRDSPVFPSSEINRVLQENEIHIVIK